MAEPSLQPHRYEFRLDILGPRPDEAEVRRRLDQAVQEAAQAMGKEQGGTVEAQAEIEGAVFGVGETAVVLLVAFLKGAAGATGAAAGKAFFEKYLKPRLQKVNLIPSDLRERPRQNGGA